MILIESCGWQPGCAIILEFEFLEFEFRDDGKLRYANNSNYKNDTMIRKEVFFTPVVLKECRRIISDSEIMKEDDMNWPEPDFVGRQELEIVMGNEHISFTTSKIGSLVDVQSSKDCMLVTNFVTCNLQAEVNVKIKKAYCPPQIVEGNPCLEYLKYIIFPWFREFEVERKVENGGNKTYMTFDDLTADYTREELHPADLKLAPSKSLNRILQPVRDHFKNDPKARELLKKVKAYRITR